MKGKLGNLEGFEDSGDFEDFEGIYYFHYKFVSSGTFYCFLGY